MHALTGNELMNVYAELNANSEMKIQVTGGCLHEECRMLLQEWISNLGAR